MMKVNLKREMRVLAVVGIILLTMSQATAAAVEWKGNELSKILATATSEEGVPTVSDADQTNSKKTVFLYNVAKGKFLYQGESSGTHAIYSDVGIRCWIMKRQETENGKTVDKYYIETACKNIHNTSARGSYLGNDEGNSRGPFVDMSARAWQIEPIAEGSNKYYIHNLNKNNTTSYLHANKDDRNVYRDPKNIVESRGGMNLAEWIFVTEQDMLDEFNKTSIELGGVPADATFLLGDPDFHRYSSEFSRWNWKPGTGILRVGIDYHYQAYKNNQWIWQTGAADQSGDDINNGKYWCAKINNGTGTLSQEITIKKTGWYRVLCQGEYYLKGATYNQYAFLFAKANEQTEVRQPLRITSTPIEQFSGNKNVIKNIEGSNYYNDYGDYTNTVMVFVDCGKDNSQEVKLEIGVKVEGENVPTANLGVAVDAFRLQYCGAPADHELVLDEDFNNFDYINKETQKDYKNSILYFHRSFNLGCWNTIILPVSLTADQFNTAFGANSKLAKYVGVKNDRLQFIVQDDKKAYDTDKKGAFLKANTPYIIWPTAKANQTEPYSYSTTYGNESTDQHKITVGTPYYVVNDVTLNKKNVENIIVEGEDKNGYRFNGILAQDYDKDFNFIDGAHVKAGDYTFNQGKLHQFKKDYGMKGFRAWFTQADTNTESQAKPIGVEINGVQGEEVTGLDFIEMPQAQVASYTIYNLRGQKLNVKSIEELPRGIYIVNHKKYVVK